MGARKFKRELVEKENGKFKVEFYLLPAMLNKYIYGGGHSVYIRTCFNNEKNYQVFVFKGKNTTNAIKIVNKASATSVYRIAEEYGVNITKVL